VRQLPAIVRKLIGTEVNGVPFVLISSTSLLDIAQKALLFFFPE
jgi:hypothetical protein